MDELRRYVRETDESELNNLIDSGYVVIYQDVNLSEIYEVLSNGIPETEIEQQIRNMFGYYGLRLLLQVDGMHYWLMQV